MHAGMTADKRIVIVGAGIAGTQAAESLRTAGFDGTLTMVDADAELPYNRPPLSKEFLTGALDEDDVRLWTADRIAELQVDLRLATRAVGLDVARKRLAVLSTADGADEVPYEQIILATGAVARRPSGF